MFVIGLTGGIGAGKTEVSNVLRALGAEVIQADDAARETYNRHTPGWHRIVAEFGVDVLTSQGDLDRNKLGSIVFKNKEALQKLNAIVHPLTRLLIEQRLERLRESGAEIVVVEIPVLVEAVREDLDWISLIDEVWVIDADESEVVERVQKRSRLDAEAVIARIRSQASPQERFALADIIIENNGSLTELSSRMKELWDDRVIQKRK